MKIEDEDSPNRCILRVEMIEPLADNKAFDKFEQTLLCK